MGSKVASADFFWSTVEQIYGEVPNLIKLILQVNGFNSFLALKGIRYEDKQEFFQSLELTVVDLLGSECESPEKSEMEAELTANHQHVNNFRLKPGHRNYIMNLMLEIEKMDVNEFFGRLSNESVATETPMSKPQFAIENVRTTPTKVFVRRSGKQVVLSPSRDADHGYSRDEQEADQDYVFEEEYLTDETMDDIIKLEFDPIEHRQTRKRKSSTAPSSGRRRPEHMYNEEFIAKINNPRRRRVALNKSYPATTEGTRDRFADLIRQSLQCILPREKLAEVENAEIHVEKETDTSWAVYCPLCHARIRLPVVFENGGRYCNYKRSNFERHLRFKHCKSYNAEVFEATEAAD